MRCRSGIEACRAWNIRGIRACDLRSCPGSRRARGRLARRRRPPCFGSDGGASSARRRRRPIAIRAGRLFDSKTGQMLTNQVVLLDGERITDVGPEAQVKIPAGAQVIDLSQATVLPGLIDAHTHMFNTPEARHVAGDLHADRRPERAGRPAGGLHRGARHEHARQRLRRCRYPQRHQRGPHRRPALSGVRPRHRLGRHAARPAPGQPAGQHRGALGRGSPRRGPRARRAWRRLDQAVPDRRLFVQPDRRGRNTC